LSAGRGYQLQASDRVLEEGGPGCAAGEVQGSGADVVGDAGRDGEQPQP
jgi:hypothetical protein